MSDKTKIEWADATANPVNGCTVISPGCTNCYAMRLAGARLRNHPSRAGLTQQSKAGPVWNGTVRWNERQLMQPLKWRKPRKIFWNAHGDLFHDAVPDEWIDKVFAVCALTPQHTHMILTKRPKRMRDYMTYSSRPDKFIFYREDGSSYPIPDSRMRVESALCGLFAKTPARQLNLAAKLSEIAGFEGIMQGWPLPNVWLGVSVEDQERADERIQNLLETPAAIRFISAEPLLGPLDLREIQYYPGFCVNSLTGCCDDGSMPDQQPINWVIVGAESGPGARTMANEWAQSIVDQCRETGTAVFVKQLSSGGSNAIHDIEAFPQALQVREFPEVAAS